MHKCNFSLINEYHNLKSGPSFFCSKQPGAAYLIIKHTFSAPHIEIHRGNNKFAASNQDVGKAVSPVLRQEEERDRSVFLRIG